MLSPLFVLLFPALILTLLSLEAFLRPGIWLIRCCWKLVYGALVTGNVVDCLVVAVLGIVVDAVVVVVVVVDVDGKDDDDDDVFEEDKVDKRADVVGTGVVEVVVGAGVVEVVVVDWVVTSG